MHLNKLSSSIRYGLDKPDKKESLLKRPFKY